MEAKIQQLISLYKGNPEDITEIVSLQSQIDPNELCKHIFKDCTNYKREHRIVDKIVTIAYHLKNMQIINTVATNNAITQVGRLIALEDWDNSLMEMTEILFKQIMNHRIDEEQRCELATSIPSRFLYKMASMFNKWTEYPNSMKVYQTLIDGVSRASSGQGFKMLINRSYKRQENTFNIILDSGILLNDICHGVLKYYLS